MPGEPSTRDRIIDEAMRLFGERGYAATTVAEIEAAAGLSSGAGGLYRHFRSKRALLDAGVRRQIESHQELLARLRVAASPEASVLEQLRQLAHAGLERLDRERDLNRLIVRDLRAFPDLLDLTAEGEMRPVHQALAAWLAGHDAASALDLEAVAAVLAGATAHFWVLRDVFGEHPTGVSADRYVAALAELVAAALGGTHAAGRGERPRSGRGAG